MISYDRLYYTTGERPPPLPRRPLRGPDVHGGLRRRRDSARYSDSNSNSNSHSNSNSNRNRNSNNNSNSRA